MFSVQIGDLESSFCGGDTEDKATYVNSRSFVDQITWFGEPEEIFTTISGISFSPNSEHLVTTGASPVPTAG